jgi:DNA-binding MarR family transcriptional regulator
MHEHERDEVIPEIISEFSQAFAAARTRWAKYAEAAHPELRGPSFFLLQTIVRHGPVTATGLAGILNQDKAMISRQIANLRELDLIQTKPADQDRRVTLIIASPAAHEALEGLQSYTADAYRARFADWNTDDLAHLQRLLHRFNANADELRGDGPARRCAREAETETETHSPE